MIPIGDTARRRTFPVVNLLLIAANIAVFIYELSLSEREIIDFFFDWGVVPTQLINALHNPGDNSNRELLTPFTAMFIHGGWLHLIGNMVFLWVFGDNIEDSLGHLRYLIFYVLAGLGAVALQVFLSSSDQQPMIGASGAIAGVLGAYLILYPRSTVAVLIPTLLFWTVYVPAVVLIGAWFLMQLFSSVAAIGDATEASAGVAWWAHVGGFLTGIVLVFLFNRRARRFWPG